MLICTYGRNLNTNSSFINCHPIHMVTSLEGRGSLESCHQPRQAVVYFDTYNKYSWHLRNILHLFIFQEQEQRIVYFKQ